MGREIRDIRSRARWVRGGLDETGDPDVIGLWLFDENASPLVEEINEYIVPEVGSPTYGTIPSAGFEAISPGTTLNGVNNNFKAAVGAYSGLDVGTSDFTVELWYEMGVVSTSRYAFAFLDASDGDKGYSLVLRSQAGSEAVQMFVKSADGTSVTWGWSVSPATDGTDPQHLRVTVDRDGVAELFFDGVSQGTTSTLTMSGKNIPANDLTIGAYVSNVLRFPGDLYYLRISKNLTNSNYPL